MSEQTEYESNEDGTEDSSVIRELRAKVKAFEKQAEANAELAQGLAQAKLDAIAGFIDRPGSPKLLQVVAESVDGFPTRDKVEAVLADLGLAESKTPVEANDDASAPTAPNVREVAGLGQRAASAASGAGTITIEDELRNATSESEIVAIMAKAGLTA